MVCDIEGEFHTQWCFENVVAVIKNDVQGDYVRDETVEENTGDKGHEENTGKVFQMFLGVTENLTVWSDTAFLIYIPL